MNEKQSWLLMADARSGLLRRWLPVSSAVVVFILLQTVGGRYEETSTILLAWAWAGIGLLAPTLLLYLSAWLNKYPAKLTSPSTFRALRGISTAHGILMLLTLSLFPLALHNNLTTEAYLRLSLLWVCLGSAAVSTGLYLVLFKKESRLRPNALILQEVAHNEAEKALHSGNQARLQCLELLAANQIAEALNLLRSHFAQSPDETSQVVVLQGRFSDVSDRLHKGLLEEGEAQLEINKITETLLNLTKFIKK